MKDETRNIPLKNYLILFVICLITIATTLYFCKCYQVYSESMLEIPVIKGTLSEITSKELNHYVLENPNCTIYMCTASDKNCRNFETDFIKLIKKENLQNSIVYLNLSDVNQEEFVKEFNDKYNYKVKLTENYPAIVIFEDSSISSILQETEAPLSINRAKQFIELNKIGE